MRQACGVGGAALTRVGFSVLIVACATAAAGCPAEGGGDLFLRLRTDVRPGVEFSTARVQLVGATTASDARQSVTYGPDDAAALLAGVRLADFNAVGSDSASIRVTLFDDAGRAVVERGIQVSNIRANTAVTAVITRDCRGVACPDPGGDPELTACLAGRCVSPRCIPEDMSACPSPSCAADEDCSAASPCADAICGSGACLQEPHDDRCGPAEWCSPENGCLPDGTVPADAGTDSGLVDGGLVDSGLVDSGLIDSGVADSGGIDAGDAGDSGSGDAGADTGADVGTGARCGDGSQDLGEQCDDGNTIAGDGCGPSCRIEGDSCRDPMDMAAVATANPDGTLTFVGSLAYATDSIDTSAISTPDRVLYWDAPSEGWMTWTTDTMALEFDSHIRARSDCALATSELARNDDFGGMYGPFGTSSFLKVAVTAGQRVFLIVEPNESGCCAFDLIVGMVPFLEIGMTCDPSFAARYCRPSATCAAADGGFTCQ